MNVTPAYLRYASQLRGSTKTGVIANALSAAAERIESLTAEYAGIIEFLGKHSTEQADEIERLRAALESLTRDPPATLDEPDTDAEVVIKMRAIARDALEQQVDHVVNANKVI